jgi:hypothetical protein
LLFAFFAMSQSLPPRSGRGSSVVVPGAGRVAPRFPPTMQRERALGRLPSLDETLHHAGVMRLAVGLGIAFAACGCADGESATNPRTARDARFDDPMPTRATPIEDDFDDALSRSLHITPPAERPPSRSLGYLGDQPIGELPTPPHREPAWTRPFPCQWTNTCRQVPLQPYYPPYVEVYSGD